MGKVSVDQCDGCGTYKKDSNKWWAVGHGEDEFTICTFETRNEAKLYFCGRGCLLEYTQNWLQKVENNESTLTYTVK